jgi:Tol biopolymer transport system component
VFLTGGCDDREVVLHTVRTDGSEPRRLTGYEADGSAWGPTWSPDGDAIWVTVLDPEWVLGVLDPDGSALERVSGPIAGAHPRLQPAGT